MISETYRINQVGLKTKGIVRVASTQNFEDFKGFSVLNPFSKTLIADIECSWFCGKLRHAYFNYGAKKKRRAGKTKFETQKKLGKGNEWIDIEIEGCKETLLSKENDRSPKPLISFPGWVIFDSGAISEERKWDKLSLVGPHWITFKVGARMERQSVFNSNICKIHYCVKMLQNCAKFTNCA